MRASAGSLWESGRALVASESFRWVSSRAFSAACKVPPIPLPLLLLHVLEKLTFEEARAVVLKRTTTSER